MNYLLFCFFRWEAQFGITFWYYWKFKADWHEVNWTPPPPWRGVNEDGFGWLTGQSLMLCSLLKKVYCIFKKKEKNNNNYPLRVSPDRIGAAWVSWLLVDRLLTGNKSMNSRSSWGCEPIRKQRMRHKGHELGRKKKDDTVLSQPATTETEEDNFCTLQLEGHARDC